MKKIGVVNLRFYPALGGAETLILEICKRLTNKFDITIITSDIKTELPYKKLAETEMIDEYQTLKIERLTSKHLLPLEGYGNVLRGLKKELKNFDIIHTYGYGYYHTDRSIRVAKKFNIPSVFTPLLHKAFFAKHKFLRSIYDSTRGKRTLELANRIIGLSNEEKKYLSKRFGIREDKITVVPCGVDLEKFKDLGKEKENELLFVGRLSPVKSLEILVKALAIVKKDIPDIKLKLAGEDWGVKESLRNLALELGATENIDFLGKVSNDKLIDLYNEAKLFVTSTKYESFGISILEAIACGTPVVASNVGGIPEVIGNCGLLCERSPEDFAQNILKILKDSALYSKCKENTRTWRENFSWDVIAEKISNIYSEMLK